MKIYLLRHGATDWAEEGRIQGHTDNPLNPHGKSQAASAGCFFARMNERIDIIVSSPLLRAFQSAEIVADKIGYDKKKSKSNPHLSNAALVIWKGIRPWSGRILQIRKKPK